MKAIRIIPRLDVKGHNLVKGVHLEGLRVLGLPERFSNLVIAETEYSPNTFCSVIKRDNVVGCQFHPERSGLVGLQVYRKFAFEE